MSPSRTRALPLGGRALGWLIVAALAGGCSAHDSGPQSVNVWPWSQEPQKVAALVPPPKPDVEDDGVEAQVAPPRSIREQPDDPREPWSRNYGPAPLPRRADIPPDLPADFRSRLVASVPE